VNVKEYISSGIIESYVLGLATEAERNEFEVNCAQYPEIAEARNTFEQALEDQLLKDATVPPQFLKQQIEEKIKTTSSEINAEEFEQETTPVRRIGIWRWIAAASLILLAGSVYWAVTTNKKYQDLQAQNRELESRMKESTAQLDTLKHESEILSHPEMRMAVLKGTQIAPKAYATVYWDTTDKKDVYLMVNNLPQPASDKQYQLWALLDGKPIDLGVFNMEIRQKHLLVKMQNVQKAQAFAITLEPMGGSTSPTLDSMYVMGSL
jgi:anti-sigma-K factor RskA